MVTVTGLNDPAVFPDLQSFAGLIELRYHVALFEKIAVREVLLGTGILRILFHEGVEQFIELFIRAGVELIQELLGFCAYLGLLCIVTGYGLAVFIRVDGHEKDVLSHHVVIVGRLLRDVFVREL